VLRRLRDAVGAHLAEPPEIRVEAADSGPDPGRRITEDTVRNGRLRELVDEEPALGEAVQELDLELLD
jgi:hypothetical protein